MSKQVTLSLKDLELSRKAECSDVLMRDINIAQYVATEKFLREEGVNISEMDPESLQFKAFASLRLNAVLRLFVAHCIAVGLHPADVVNEVVDGDFKELAISL